MKYTLLTALMLTAAAFIPAHAETSDKTKDFVMNAGVSNMFEIESSKLALSKKTSDAVKTFAQDMIKDHSKAGADMKAALAKSNTGLKAPKALDEKHQDKLNTLKEKDGEDFDKAYVEAQSDAHDEAVSLFKEYADDGDNPSLKSFAAATLPTLETHKDHVEHLEDSQ